MNLGKRLADVRRKRGLATGELAARAQVTSGFISQLEHNKTSPSLATLKAHSGSPGRACDLLAAGG